MKANQLMNINSLNTLDLSSNRIDTLDDCAFHGIQRSIRKLYLNFNQITRLNSCAFMSNFNHLRFVQILYNPLDCSTNCEFFYTVYQKPYSINYEGIECSSNFGSGGGASQKPSRMKHCTQKQYEKISKRCQKKLINNRCFRLTINETQHQQQSEQTTKNRLFETANDISLSISDQINADYYDQELSFEYGGNSSKLDKNNKQTKQNSLFRLKSLYDSSSGRLAKQILANRHSFLIQSLLTTIISYLLKNY